MTFQDSLQTYISSEKFTQRAKSYLEDNKRSFILSVSCILAVLLVVFKITLQPSVLVKDFKNIQEIYDKWSKDSILDFSLLNSLKKNLEKHPELASKYEGKVLQEWTLKGQSEKMPAYIEQLFKKISKGDFSYYRDFTGVTFSIQKKDFEKALNNSINLKDAMIADKSFWEGSTHSPIGSYLYAYNLIRIVMLSQKTEKNECELAALRELRQLINLDPISNNHELIILNKNALEELVDHFSENQVSFKDYIKYREQLLLQTFKG